MYPKRHSIAALAWALFTATPIFAEPGDNNLCDEPGEVPDIIVGDIRNPLVKGHVGDIRAFSFTTESCNVGTCHADWFFAQAAHPVISQNMFRLKDGRFDQLGQAWLKHGFSTLDDPLCATPEAPCIPGGGQHLGVNCSDTYTGFLNGQQNNMGPKFEVNASTGVFPYPPTDLSLTGDGIYKRLQVHNDDLDPALNAGATYFIEAQYVTADESAAGTGNNNNGWRECVVTDFGLPSFAMSTTGPTMREAPAIYAWQANEPGVQIQVVQIPGDGLLWVGHNVTDLGGGMYRYEYAIQNTTSHRSARSFSIGLGSGTTLSNVGFHDVDYHSGEPFDGTDWPATVTPGGDVTWSTDTFASNQNANALRWATLYNFSFDADAPPCTAPATIGLFRPGTPAEVSVVVRVPQGAGCENCHGTGDVNCSGAADIDDVDGAAALWVDPSQPLSQLVDMNFDGAPDGNDIPLFVTKVLSP